MNIRRNRAKAREAEADGEDKNDWNDHQPLEHVPYDARDDGIVDAQLIPSDAEKKHLLTMFSEMRKESFFCDVAISCHDVLFRAHKVVISSWSRWLRAILCEAPEGEILALDVFSPQAFGAVLDYMYGTPLSITVESADSVLKVVRRLEMQKLEQQIWRYLMTVIDPATNCETIHELADRYDCPPLKLAAWRILQETIPGYNTSPAAKLLKKSTSKALTANAKIGTGLTGPGESETLLKSSLRRARRRSEDQEDDDDDQQDSENLPSVFDNIDDEEDEEKEGRSSDDDDGEPRKHKVARLRPDQLDQHASATDVVKAWAFHLKNVYESCMAADGAQYHDKHDFLITDKNPHVRLVKRPAAHAHGHSREEEESVGQQRMKIEAGPPTPTSGGQRRGPTKTFTQQGGQKEGDSPGSRSKGDAGAAARSKSPQSTASSAKPKEESAAAPTPVTRKPLRSMLSMNRSKYVNASSSRSIDWKDELRRFYLSVNMPEKIAGIPTILETWQGKEEQLIAALVERYKQSIPAHMLLHLDQLQAILESQTESSFVRASSGNEKDAKDAKTRRK